jgi:hypothetical protein
LYPSPRSRAENSCLRQRAQFMGGQFHAMHLNNYPGRFCRRQIEVLRHSLPGPEFSGIFFAVWGLCSSPLTEIHYTMHIPTKRRETIIMSISKQQTAQGLREKTISHPVHSETEYLYEPSPGGDPGHEELAWPPGLLPTTRDLRKAGVGHLRDSRGHVRVYKPGREAARPGRQPLSSRQDYWVAAAWAWPGWRDQDRRAGPLPLRRPTREVWEVLIISCASIAPYSFVVRLHAKPPPFNFFLSGHCFSSKWFFGL